MLLRTALWCVCIGAAVTVWWFVEIRPRGFVPAFGQPDSQQFSWRRALVVWLPVGVLLASSAALAPWTMPYDVVTIVLPFLALGVGMEVVRRRHNRAYPAPEPSMLPFTTASAGAGAAWYPDPWAVATWRWWDGATWTGWTA